METYTIHKGTMRQLPRNFGLEWWAWGLIWFVAGLMLGLGWRIS